MDKQTTSVTINGLRTELLFGARYRVRFGKESRMIWNGELAERAANGDLLFLEHGDPSNFTEKRTPERIRVRPSTIDALFGSGTEALDDSAPYPAHAATSHLATEDVLVEAPHMTAADLAAYTPEDEAYLMAEEAGPVERPLPAVLLAKTRGMTARERAVSGRKAETVIPFGPVTARVRRGTSASDPAPAAPAAGTKVCKRCKTDKPADAFGTVSRNADGLNIWCRACDAEARALRSVTKAAAVAQRDLAAADA